MIRRRDLPSIILGRRRLVPFAAVLAFEAKGLIAARDGTANS